MILRRRILLIEPPFDRLFHERYSLDKFPLSLGYLAGTVKERTDWEVLAYNADFAPGSIPKTVSYLAGEGFQNYRRNLSSPGSQVWRDVETTIRKYMPSVVGITCKTQNLESAAIVARTAKAIQKDTVVIVGGPHPSMAYADTMSRNEFDVCVRGEGENTLIELLGKIDDRTAWKNIQGICYRDDGNLVVTPDRELIGDLDSLCLPNEHAPALLKDYEKYPRNAFRHVFAVRGCPYNCWFCGSRYVWSRRVRRRSPANVAEEIRLLRKRGINSVHFDDDTFGISKDYIASVSDQIRKSAPGTAWECEINAKLIDDEVLDLMKRSGCTAIELGIESGNNEILEKIRKGITIEEAITACHRIKNHGMRLSVFFMVGFPWETEATLKDTLNAIRMIEADRTIYSIFMPYPGTEAFEFCKEKGLIGRGFDSSLYNHQSPENCFCLNMDHEVFRSHVRGIEEEVDRLNNRGRKRYLMQKLKTLSIREIASRVREAGVKNSLRRIYSLASKGSR
jgi:anaerobic magnesium-protoporphyrin IX monomethyl ester cyclase